LDPKNASRREYGDKRKDFLHDINDFPRGTFIPHRIGNY
jgi:hypothetical protein